MNTTIDEAKSMLIAKANCIDKQCKGIHEDCNESLCDNCVLCYAQGTNSEQIKLLRQCAEWLEELKAYKKNSNTCPMCDTYCSYLAEEFENGYNKAIDDFVNFASTMPTVEQKDGTIRPMWLKEMAEQLKAGENNEISGR